MYYPLVSLYARVHIRPLYIASITTTITGLAKTYNDFAKHNLINFMDGRVQRNCENALEICARSVIDIYKYQVYVKFSTNNNLLEVFCL